MLKQLTVPGLVLLAALLASPGCERPVSPVIGAETDDAGYQRAKQLERQGRKQEALAAYLKVIGQRGDAAPESHLDAGLIYMNDVKDPIASIYHFRRYLELQPNAVQAPHVRGLVDSAHREFARMLPGNLLENQSLRVDLMDQVERLQREVDQLRAELSVARSGAALTVNRMTLPVDNNAMPGQHTAPPVLQDVDGGQLPGLRPSLPARQNQPGPATAAASQPSGRVHVVTQGDTLSSLAQRYYSNRSRWREIYEANRDQMPNENALRVGMELRIP